MDLVCETMYVIPDMALQSLKKGGYTAVTTKLARPGYFQRVGFSARHDVEMRG